MAYEKNTWANGDTITAEKLNHMEDGIAEDSGGGGGVFIVNVTGDSEKESDILDKTFGEILDAYESGKMILLKRNSSEGSLALSSVTEVDYTIIPDSQGYGAVGTADGGAFNANIPEEPYTLDALRQQYPYNGW